MTHHDDTRAHLQDIETLYGELALLQKEILALDKKLHTEIKARKTAQAAMQAIHKSTSWRITRPMRAVMHKLRRS